LVKSSDFNLPHLYFSLPLKVTALEFRRDLWRQKTRVPDISYDVVLVILRSALFVQYRLLTYGRTDRRTDRQTDRQTHDDSIYCGSIASCSNNSFAD